MSRVARPEFAADRPALAIEHRRDDQLARVGPVILAMVVLANALAAVPLEDSTWHKARMAADLTHTPNAANNARPDSSCAVGCFVLIGACGGLLTGPLVAILALKLNVVPLGIYELGLASLIGSIIAFFVGACVGYQIAIWLRRIISFTPKRSRKKSVRKKDASALV